MALVEKAVPDELESETRKSIFQYVLSATMALEFGRGLQNGVFNNFVVEVLHITPAQLGFIQGIREVPGLLTAPLAVVSGFFRENIWAGVCLIATAAGLALHSVTFVFPMLILATLVYSTGFHLFFPVQQSIVMKASHQDERATRMGQLNSGGAMASLASLAVVMLLTRSGGKVSYGWIHLGAALSVLLGGLAVLARQLPGSAPTSKSMNYDRKYMSYYILTLLSGSRRHITMTFAGYLLVSVYSTPVSTMVLLTALSSVVAVITRPLIGKVVDGWGEQRSLVLNYCLVILMFFGYAVFRNIFILYIVFVLDHGLQGFDVAITTHLGKIAPKEVLSAAYAMGSTINHVTGVSVPMLGGYLWDITGPASVFVGGAAIALASLLYSMKLDRLEKASDLRARSGS